MSLPIESTLIRTDYVFEYSSYEDLISKIATATGGTATTVTRSSEVCPAVDYGNNIVLFIYSGQIHMGTQNYSGVTTSNCTNTISTAVSASGMTALSFYRATNTLIVVGSYSRAVVIRAHTNLWGLINSNSNTNVSNFCPNGVVYSITAISLNTELTQNLLVSYTIDGISCDNLFGSSQKMYLASPNPIWYTIGELNLGMVYNLLWKV